MTLFFQIITTIAVNSGFHNLHHQINPDKSMIQFILNNKTIQTDLPRGMTVLDFVRYQQHLMGTKIGCREGDCGACTVLIGELSATGEVVYRSMTSCLLPLANVQNKHVVTVEGINPSC